MKNLSDQKLENLYPDEIELAAWFSGLPDSLQYDLDVEFSELLPCWYSFLRQKRWQMINKDRIKIKS